MIAITYFGECKDNGKLRGSSFGNPDGTEHCVEILEGNGKMILRVSLADAETVEMIFTDKQARDFTAACVNVLSCLGLK